MKVPVDLSKRVSTAQTTPHVNASSAVQAIGEKGRSVAAIGAVGEKLAGIAFNNSMDERDKEIYADSANFRTKLSGLRIKANEELKQIPIKDGIDYKTESDAIFKKYSDEANDWLNDAGNVRHSVAMQDFQQALKEKEGEAQDHIAEFGYKFERDRNISHHEKEIELGIMTGSEEAIVNGYNGLVAAGKHAGDKAEVMALKSIRAMNEKQDEQGMIDFRQAVRAGDKKAAREIVNGLRVPTQKEKNETYTVAIEDHDYSSAKNYISEMVTSNAGLSEFQATKEAIMSGKMFKDMNPSQHKLPVLNQINRNITKIETAQKRNLSDINKSASSGDLEGAMIAFRKAKASDGKDGIPKELIDQTEQSIIDSAKAYETGESYKAMEAQAKASDRSAYIELESNLAAASLNPEDFDLSDMMNSIDGMNMASPIKAKFLSEALLIESARYGDIESMERPQSFQIIEMLPFVAVYKQTFGKEEVQDSELSVLAEIHKELGGEVKAKGAYDGLPSQIKSIQEKVFNFYRDNEDPSSDEVEGLKLSILKPLKRKMIRDTANGSVQ